MDYQFINNNRSYLTKILYLSVLILISVVGYFLWYGKYNRLLMVVAVPFVLLIITNPRLAVYQFIFSIFLFIPIIDEIPLNLIDLSAMLVILSALFDLLFSGKLPKSFPKLFPNLCFLLMAIIITGIFGYDPNAAWRPLARVTFLTITFLSFYRLLPLIRIEKVILAFFWLMVIHSAINLVPFILSGGTIRSFGLLSLAFDEIAMIAFIFGMAYFLWNSSRFQILYALGSIVVLGALIATQSRAAIMYAFIVCVIAVVISFYRQKKLLRIYGYHNLKIQRRGLIGLRVSFLGFSIFSLIAVVIVVNPLFFVSIFERFEELMTYDMYGSFYIRLELWRTAILSFLNDPITGSGPGSFRNSGEILPMLHLRPAYHLIKNLSAHNLFLHYLSETGLIGTTALVALIINQFRLSLKLWKDETRIDAIPYKLSLLLVSIAFLISTFIEAGWLWGQDSFVFIMFLAIISYSANECQSS